MKGPHYQHMITHLKCGLRFIVLSDEPAWPNPKREGADGNIRCPEDGEQTAFAHWSRRVDGPMFDPLHPHPE